MFIYFRWNHFIKFRFAIALRTSSRNFLKNEFLNNLGSYGKSNVRRLAYLVPFVQFKKREKYPWRSVTSSKVAG